MKIKKVVAIVLLAIILVFSNLVTNASTKTPSKLLIPTYFYSSTIWSQAYSTMTSGDIAILNPNNGVGSTKDTNYTNVINTLKSKGITPVGYVYTLYGDRDIASVNTQIDNWYNWYGIKDIFFDETSNTSAKVQWYIDRYRYVKQRNGLVILNPGTTTIESYMSASDIICVFEDTYSNYISTRFPAWQNNYSPSRFLHLIHTCSESQYANAIALAATRNVDYIYITDDAANTNPWNSLASYFVKEKALLLNAATTTTAPSASPTPTAIPSVKPINTPTPTPIPWGSLSITNTSTNLVLTVNGTSLSTKSQFYINSDNLNTTGFRALWKSSGFEYLVENNCLYKYSGNGTSWSWTFVKNISLSKTSTKIVVTVPLTKLGITTNKTIHVGFIRNDDRNYTIPSLTSNLISYLIK